MRRKSRISINRNIWCFTSFICRETFSPINLQTSFRTLLPWLKLEASDRPPQRLHSLIITDAVGEQITDIKIKESHGGKVECHRLVVLPTRFYTVKAQRRMIHRNDESRRNRSALNVTVWHFFLLWLLPTAFDCVDLQPVADIHTLTVAELLIMSLAAPHCLFYTYSKGKPLYVFTQGSTALLLFIKKAAFRQKTDWTLTANDRKWLWLSIIYVKTGPFYSSASWSGEMKQAWGATPQVKTASDHLICAGTFCTFWFCCWNLLRTV